MKKKLKTNFTCQSCGYTTPKWMGKCPECNQWDSFIEERAVSSGKFPSKKSSSKNLPVEVSQIPISSEARTPTGIAEFDRVLGGGIVTGSLVLIGGDPGIGKSTLMLQALSGLGEKGKKVLYVSGEESLRQIKLRSERIGSVFPKLMALAEIDLSRILEVSDELKPDVIVIDSVQTMYNPELNSAPGSVSQVRETTLRLMVMAKSSGIPVFLIGHVTKDGSIAGPRVMEHMVDTVLYFEGDRNYIFRILRAVKNRFGSTNEIGVFEMKGQGLNEVLNPSAVFLSERPENSPGSIVTASMEGTRPILVEIQGLVSSSNLGTPRRTVLGLDSNRVALLVAVIEKKIGMQLSGLDIYMNVAGGVKITEPAVDMGIISAITSSFLDKPMEPGTVILGEVGLTGEIRAISQIESRVNEIKKMGFTHCIIPFSGVKQLKSISGIKITGVKTVAEALEIIF